MNLVDDYLFDSAYSALCFAYRYNTHQYAPTPLAKMMRGSIGNSKGLHGLDGAAQAGLIMGKIEKFPVFERAAIAARFGGRNADGCAAKILLITPATASLGTGVHSRRMVDNLVQKFFGEKAYLKDLAALVGIHPNTITDRWSNIKRVLTELERRAIDRAESEFRGSGLISS